MSGGEDGAWRTLVLLYSVVFAAAICLPPITILPLVFGLDSLLLLLCAGTVGLAVTGGVTSLFVARYDARVDQSPSDASDPVDPSGDDGH